MSTLERGFKSWCERRAASLRIDLGLTEAQPVEVFDVARHLNVTLLTPKDIDGLDPDHLGQLLKRDSHGWSAVTMELRGRTIIIYNPTHSRGRIASDLAHELAHLLLEHDGSRMILSVDVPFLLRTYDAKQEEEANWLGWTILLPRAALLRRREQGKSPAEIAKEFGVSRQLVTFRLLRTSVDRQLARRRR